MCGVAACGTGTFLLQLACIVGMIAVLLVAFKDMHASKDGASGKPTVSDGKGHVLGTVAATHELPLTVAPVLPKDVLRSIDQLHVTVPDAEYGVDVVISMRVSEVKQINRTAIVFHVFGGKELHIINGVSFLRQGDGTEQVVCSADVTCAAFEVESAELAEHYLALAEAELEPHAKERRRRMQTCDPGEGEDCKFDHAYAACVHEDTSTDAPPACVELIVQAFGREGYFQTNDENADETCPTLVALDVPDGHNLASMCEWSRMLRLCPSSCAELGSDAAAAFEDRRRLSEEEWDTNKCPPSAPED